MAADRGNDHPDGRYSYGSAVLVNGDVALTCAHVVDRALRVFLDGATGERFEATVIASGDPRGFEAPDLALLRIESKGAAAAPPLPLGEVDRSEPGDLEGVQIAGWPEFMETDGRQRVVFATTGTINVLSRLRDGLLRFDADMSPPRTEPGGSPWRGLSGAPVVADGRLVAVVTEHRAGEGPLSLTAIPLTAIGSGPGAGHAGQPTMPDHALWWKSLGVSDPSALVLVRPGPRAPLALSRHRTYIAGLRDHRSRLLPEISPYVPPPPGSAWDPAAIWSRLTSPETDGAELLVGHGGLGKTRTLLEVARIAEADGWTVLHLEPRSSDHVVEYLTDRFAVTSSPVLVVADYLNRVQDKGLDLGELVASVRQHRDGGYPRAAFLATARTGWIMQHSSQAQEAEHSLVRVDVAPGRVHLDRIATSILEVNAPEAVRTLGMGALLALTGTNRPIITLLVGLQIEQQIASAGSGPNISGPRSPSLRSWLESRLAEAGLTSGDSVWSPTVDDHVRAATAMLFAMPAPRELLIDIGERCAGDTAGHILGLLEQMGWVVTAGVQRDVVHDVVTDHLAETVLYGPMTAELLPTELRRILDVLATSSHSLGQASTSLSRVVDEQEASGRSQERLHDVVNHWLHDATPHLLRTFERDGGAGLRAASALVASGLLADAVSQHWTSLFRPLVDRSTRSIEAFGLLLALAKSLPALELDAATEFSDRAVSWAVVNETEHSLHLLRALARRADTPTTAVEQAADLISRWLATSPEAPYADFVLNSLLARRDLDKARSTALMTAAVRWLEVHGRNRDASFLLGRVLASPSLPSERARLNSIAFGWLGIRGHLARRDAAFVLTGLLRDLDIVGERSELVRSACRAWLGEFAGTTESTHVLAGLLRNPSSTADDARFGIALAFTWLTLTTSSRGRGHLLVALLGRDELTTAELTEITQLSDDWLTNGPAAEGTYIIGALLDRLMRRTGATNGDFEAAAPSQAVAWLATHGRETAAAHVLHRLLRVPNLDVDQFDRALAASATWLTEHGALPEAGPLLQALLENARLPEEFASVTSQAASEWLVSHAELPAADFLIERLLGTESASDQNLLVARQAALRWLTVHGDEPNAVGLLSTLLATQDLRELEPDLVTVLNDSIRTRLDGGPSPELEYLLNGILKSEVPASLRITALEASTAWLDEYGSTVDADRLIQSLLKAPDATEAARETAVRAAGEWLQHHGTTFAASYLLQTLLRLDGSPPGIVEQASGSAQAWLAEHGEHIEANFVLQALVGKSAELPEDVRRALGDRVRRWLTRHALLPEATFLLQAVLRSGDPPPEALEAAICSTPLWLEMHGIRADACYLLQVALGGKDPSDELWSVASHHAMVWLASHGSTIDARMVLIPLLRCTDLPTYLHEPTLRALTAWFPHHGRDAGAHLLHATLTSRVVPPETRRVASRHALERCEAHGDDASTNYVLQAVLAASDLPDADRERAALLSAAWLDSHLDSPGAPHLLRTMLAVPGPGDGVRNDAAHHVLVRLSDSPARAESRFLLQSLLEPTGLPTETLTLLATVTTRWIDAHGTTPAGKAFQTGLLKNHRLAPELRWSVARHALRRSQERPAEEETNYVLQAVLAVDGLPHADRHLACDLARTWLTTHGLGTPSASYLLRAVLSSQEPGDDVRQDIVQLALTWLAKHGREAPASFVIGNLLAASAVDPWRRNVLTRLHAWLECHGESPNASYLFPPALEHADPHDPLTRVSIDAAMRWLDRHSTTLRATYVLQSVLAVAELPDDVRPRVQAAASEWLAAAGETPSRDYLLRALSRAGLLQGIVSSPNHSSATPSFRTLQRLLGSSDPFVHQNAAEVAVTLLAQHDTPTVPNQMVNAVLKATGVAQPERLAAVTAALGWIERYPYEPGGSSLLVVLLRSANLPDTTRDSIHDHTLSWLEHCGLELSAQQLLVVVARDNVLTEQHGTEILAAALRWVEQHGDTWSASAVLLMLLTASDLHPPEVAKVCTASLSWLRLFPSAPESGRLLRELLERGSLDGRDDPFVDDIVRGWLAENEQSQHAGTTMLALLRSEPLARPLRRAAVEATDRWLGRPSTAERVPAALVDAIRDACAHARSEQ
ncbi:S1 family peptidase [Cellulosimicrobium cellulans]|uniref:S1 family peptidase n=1 Tax=Cellulosimicrobium cellulans TaxID=1710 RepID=UPI0024053B99|nr:serine protease [Cellulosimicrobium cellulans]